MTTRRVLFGHGALAARLLAREGRKQIAIGRRAARGARLTAALAAVLPASSTALTQPPESAAAA